MDCPNCGEYILGNPSYCYKCNYNFTLKKVVPSEESVEFERIKSKEQEEAEEKEDEFYRNIQQSKNLQLAKNPRYEYDVVKINDLDDLSVDHKRITSTINKYASRGWKLNFVIPDSTYEVKHIEGSILKIKSTVLIFERCIKAEDI